MLLVREGQICNIVLISNNFTYILSERWYITRELYGNSCKELAGMVQISTFCREEEASTKTLLIRVSKSDSARNRRLSRAG
jgi:hypothetical protein